jgi:hypothetical protein
LFAPEKGDKTKENHGQKQWLRWWIKGKLDNFIRYNYSEIWEIWKEGESLV